MKTERDVQAIDPEELKELAGLVVQRQTIEERISFFVGFLQRKYKVSPDDGWTGFDLATGVFNKKPVPES